MSLHDTLQMPAQGGPRRKKGTEGFVGILVVSTLLHAVGFGGYMYLETLKPKPKRVLSAIPVQLVKLGVKKDPKLLPRLDTVPPPPPPSEGVALETKPKDPNEKQKPPEKQKQKEPELSKAAQRLLDAQPSNLDRALSRISNKPEAPEGDPDGDARGTALDARFGAKGYELDVMKAMQRAYDLPQTIPASQVQFLRARVLIFIAPDGRIVRHVFIESHTNQAFMSALEAMLKRMTLPPPPRDKAAYYAETGIEVLFRP